MSSYKIIECDRCNKKEKFGELTLTWFIGCDAAEGISLSRLAQFGFKIPDGFIRFHLCDMCGNGILEALKKKFNSEFNSK